MTGKEPVKETEEEHSEEKEGKRELERKIQNLKEVLKNQDIVNVFHIAHRLRLKQYDWI